MTACTKGEASKCLDITDCLFSLWEKDDILGCDMYWKERGGFGGPCLTMELLSVGLDGRCVLDILV